MDPMVLAVLVSRIYQFDGLKTLLLEISRSSGHLRDTQNGNPKQ